MTPYSKTYEEYLEWLKKNLNWFERFSDKLSGLDERVDYTNKLLIQIANTLAGITPGGAPIDYTPLFNAIIAALAALSGGVSPIANRPALITGQKNVTTAGTAVQLPDIKIPDGFKVIIMAKPENTGYIYLGNSAVSAEDLGSRFSRLEAGDSIALQITTLKLVWIDASVSGEGISYCAEA